MGIRIRTCGAARRLLVLFPHWILPSEPFFLWKTEVVPALLESCFVFPH